MDTTLSDYVASIEYLPLYGSEKHVIGRVTKSCVRNGRIILFDGSLDKLVGYDLSGNFIYEVNHRGHAEKEYLEIANFAVSDNHIYTIDNFKHRISIYSLKDGSYIGTKDIAFIAWDIACFDDNHFLFTMLENNKNGALSHAQEKYAVWATDSAYKIKDRYLPYAEDYYEIIGKGRYFSVCADKILFSSFMRSGYYRFDKNGTCDFVAIDFENPIPASFSGTWDDVLKNNYNYVDETPYALNDYLVFSIGRLGYAEMALVDVKNDVAAVNKSTDAHNLMMDIIGMYDGSLLSYIDSYDTYANLVAYGFAKADEKAERLLRKNGMCLLKYKLK